MSWSKQSFFACLALALLASGCKDKSLDDYNRDRANAEFTQAQAAAGNWRGTIVTQAGSGETVSAIEVAMQVVQVPVQNGTNTGNTVRSQIQGAITIKTGDVVSSGVITNASYTPSNDDNTSGTVSGTVGVPIGANTATFTLAATINGNSMSGTISPSNASGTPGNFRAEREAPLPHVGQGSTDPSLRGGIKYYGGSLENAQCSDPQFRNSIFCRGTDNGRMPVTLSVNYNPLSAGYAFVNLFVSLKVLAVQVTFGHYVASFPSTELDQRSGVLHFQGTEPGGTSQSSLNCQPRGPGYSCEYRNEFAGQVFNFDVAPSNHP
jgi:hypothetical protein